MNPLKGIVKDAHDAGFYFGIPGAILCLLANVVLFVGSTTTYNGVQAYWSWAVFWNNLLYPLGYLWMLIGWGTTLSIIPAWWMHCQLSGASKP